MGVWEEHYPSAVAELAHSSTRFGLCGERLWGSNSAVWEFFSEPTDQVRGWVQLENNRWQHPQQPVIVNVVENWHRHSAAHRLLIDYLWEGYKPVEPTHTAILRLAITVVTLLERRF